MSFNIFWKLSPLVTSSANIFSHSVGCLFILFMVSFVVQKLVNLIRSHLFIFISTAMGDWSKKRLVWFMSENVLPMFSSRNFMMSHLMFKSLGHFEFIFVYDERVCYNFIDFYMQLSSFPNPTCWRDFFHCIFLPLLSKINWL